MAPVDRRVPGSASASLPQGLSLVAPVAPPKSEGLWLFWENMKKRSNGPCPFHLRNDLDDLTSKSISLCALRVCYPILQFSLDPLGCFVLVDGFPTEEVVGIECGEDWRNENIRNDELVFKTGSRANYVNYVTF